MGRKKSYERDGLVARATTLFHANGFAGTSTQMLVDALGVNRNSMYSEFGSKRALFEAALQRYDGQVVARVFESLADPHAELRDIEAWFKRFESPGSSSGLGCLMCNTAVEFGGLESVGERLVHRYFKRVRAAFQNALDNSRAAGRLAKDVDVRGEAQFLTATALGFFVMVRARAPAESLQAAIRSVRRHIVSLRPNLD